MKRFLVFFFLALSLCGFSQNTVDFEKLTGGSTSSMTLNGHTTNYNLPVVTISTSAPVLSVRINDQVYNYVPSRDAITINGVLMTSQTTADMALLLTTTVFNNDASGGGGGGAADVVTTITSGTSSTVPNGTNIVRFNNTALLTYTLTLGTTWHTSNELLIAFTVNGTLTSGMPMVNLTVVNGSGHTLSYIVNPNATYSAGENLGFKLISTIEQRVAK